MKKLKLGLKGDVSNTQVSNRLQQEMDIYEIHLHEDDLFGAKYKYLDNLITGIQSTGVKVYLHQPMMIHGQMLHVNAVDSKIADYLTLSTRILVELCEKHDIYTVVHMNYTSPENNPFREVQHPRREALIETIQNMIAFDEHIGKGRILWENGIMGVGGYMPDLELARLLSKTSLKLCFDVSHACISLNGDNDKLVETIEVLKENIEYFHVVDSMGKKHDSLIIGQGIIDFERIQDYILEKDYIYETGLADFNDCNEMMESHRVFREMYILPVH